MQYGEALFNTTIILEYQTSALRANTFNTFKHMVSVSDTNEREILVK